MKLPRITIRRLMITVAVLGVGMGLDGMRRRRAEYSSRVAYHADEYRKRLRPLVGIRDVRLPVPIEQASIRYHFKMAEKYGRAARYPWITVEPDPPEPE